MTALNPGDGVQGVGPSAQVAPAAPAGRHAARRRWALRLAGGLLAAAVLATVFAAYLSPDLVVDLANRIWACF